VLAAAVATSATGWLGLYGFAWSDYETETRPAVQALIDGHLIEFFKLAPVYGASLLERSPFALVPGLWGGGELAVYRMLAVPCLLAATALGLWLAARMRSRRSGALAGGVALGLCAANPLTLAALEIGHPEELLGGALCVVAVLLAVRERPILAGLLLGLAIANKEWALVAIGPVLLALPARRVLCLAVAGAVSVALVAPFALVGASVFTANMHGVASASSEIFQPWQIWWFFGHHGPVVRGLLGELKPGYRTAPAWIGAVSHPLVVATAAGVSVPLWLRERDIAKMGASIAHAVGERSRRVLTESDALLLLAVVLLARCMLDTWDNVYYPLPFVLALLCWEGLSFHRPPILALCSTVAVWAGCRWMASFASADAQAAFFLAWTLPLALGLSLVLYAPERLARLRGGEAQHSDERRLALLTNQAT
jgi:hypothetical protein